MADTTAQQTDTTASKRPKFVRQLSKSFEKTKESMKRNLLTPRGPKTARSASTELPFPEARTSTDVSAPQVYITIKVLLACRRGSCHHVKLRPLPDTKFEHFFRTCSLGMHTVLYMHTVVVLKSYRAIA